MGSMGVHVKGGSECFRGPRKNPEIGKNKIK
jgi:hypothetical protein